MHAEATSEKLSLGWYLDGRVTAVVGTHTHIPTADERVMPGGTAYITDVGMTGPYDSVIGVQKEMIIARFLNNMPARFEAATGDVRLCAVVVDCDETTGHARKIERLMLELNPCHPERSSFFAKRSSYEVEGPLQSLLKPRRSYKACTGRILRARDRSGYFLKQQLLQLLPIPRRQIPQAQPAPAPDTPLSPPESSSTLSNAFRTTCASPRTIGPLKAPAGPSFA